MRKAAEDLYDPGLNIDSSLDLLPPEALHLVARTAEAAGRAHPALMGGYEMEYLGRRFNPVVDWRTSFARAGITPDMVESYVQQLVGKYERDAAEAREREKGLSGLVARIVRFPTDVREAAGLSSKAGQTSAFVAGITVEVIAGLVLAGLLALIAYGASRLLG